MLFRDKRQENVVAEIERFCGMIGEAVSEHGKMVRDYLEGNEQFREESKHVHELESGADLIRFEVEREMHRGAFLPAYRQDYIDLLETLDRVANKAEDSADVIVLARPEIPEEIKDDLREICDLTSKCYQPIPEMVRSTLRDEHEVQEQVEEIGRLEQRIDSIQFYAVHRVYRELDLEKIDKLVLKMVIDLICGVSDRIENVGDRLSIIAIKRKMA